MCRSFMYSRMRHLLYCQDELAELQQRLLDQDKEDASTDDGLILLRSRILYECRNEDSPRNDLIKKIGPKLKEYGKRCCLVSVGVLAHISIRQPGRKGHKICIIESS